MMTRDKETANHVAEIARICSLPIDATQKIITAELAIIRRDLKTNGEAQTLFGTLKFINGKLELEHPNRQIQQMTDKDSLVSRLVSELSSDP
jgi:hypothetical protein